MNIDSRTLFLASHENLWRLCVFLRMNPVGLSRQQMVLGLLFRMNGPVK